jgi:hypothetical protein
MSSIWLVAGGSVFSIVPDGAAVMQAMSRSGLRLARGGTTLCRESLTTNTVASW